MLPCRLRMNLNQMFSKRTQLLLPLFVATAIAVTGCVQVSDKFSSALPFMPEKNLLNGRSGSNNPILVVKIDDTAGARPQVGLEKADIVYIEQVEGGLTRIAALFSSEYPELVGPVRSARISDIELLSQFGKVAFAYSGAQSKFLPMLSAANLYDIGAMKRGPMYYFNDPLRTQPFAMMVRARQLMAKVSTESVEIAKQVSPGWSFSKTTPPGGVAISSVKMRWPAQTYSAFWIDKKWHMAPGGEIEKSNSGEILAATTLAIQLVRITPSEFHDKVGGVTPFSATVGEGDGFILRDGFYFKAQWKRPTEESGTSWVSQDGTPINFAPGQVWIALTDKAPEFTLTSESASSANSK